MVTNWIVSRGTAPGSSKGVLGLQTHVFSCPGDGDHAYVGVKGTEVKEGPRLVLTNFKVEKEFGGEDKANIFFRTCYED